MLSILATVDSRKEILRPFMQDIPLSRLQHHDVFVRFKGTKTPIPVFIRKRQPDGGDDGRRQVLMHMPFPHEPKTRTRRPQRA